MPAASCACPHAHASAIALSSSARVSTATSHSFGTIAATSAKCRSSWSLSSLLISSSYLSPQSGRRIVTVMCSSTPRRLRAFVTHTRTTCASSS